MPKPNYLNAFFVAIFALLATGLAGCHLYLDDGDDNYCDEWGCTDDTGTDVVIGGSCASNYDCAAGCYCSDDGACEEFGFCESNANCPAGFVCDDRGSCVPSGGEAPPTERCTLTSDCSGEFVCDDRGLCIPPWINPPGPTCQAPVTCSADAPICPAGSTPAIESDCYTGECMLDSDCPDGAPFECSDLSESACVEDPICGSVYRGVNCTSDTGDECTSGSVNCTCESFQFDYCEEV